jgi:hypothetical protein
VLIWPVAYPRIFSVGVQQIQLRTEGRENGEEVQTPPPPQRAGTPMDMAKNRIQWQAVVH